MVSIAAICNFYNEANALPGWLESAAAFFDELVLVNAGPGGARSNDGSIEIVEKWGARLEFDTIDEGFGVLRTKLVTMSNCDWVAILDADERFHRWVPALHLHGLDVEIGQPYNQGDMLREYLTQGLAADALVTGRRHWHDFSWRRPTQSFTEIKDWQARIVRNCNNVVYRADVKMHEKIVDLRTGHCPRWIHTGEDSRYMLLWYDHYHCWFKPMEAEQRQHDINIYNCLESDQPPPSWEDWREAQELTPR